MTAFRVSVTTMDGSRMVVHLQAPDGFAAAEDILTRYGELGVRRIAAMNVRPADTVANFNEPATPVVCVEGYRGKQQP